MTHCPFCTKTNCYAQRAFQSFRNRWHVICDDCGAGGPTASTEAEAEKLWERRWPADLALPPPNTLTFSCAHCGGFGQDSVEAIDSGAALTCSKCNAETIVDLLTPQDYANQFKTL